MLKWNFIQNVRICTYIIFSMNKKIYFFCILQVCLILLSNASFAQLVESGVPASFKKTGYTIPLFEMPSFNQAALEEEDRLNNAIHHGAMRFAKAFDVNIDVIKQAKMYTLADSSRMWLLAIKSSGAYSLNITFSSFNIPDSSRLFVYSKDRSSVFGAITSVNNNPNRILAVTPVAGDEIVVEYWQPKEVSFQPALLISRVGHDYKGILGNKKKNLKNAGSCEVDINCNNGLAWQIDKRSVCRLLINNIELCTGTLLNNTSNDGTSYILTANHCVDQELKAQNTVFLFNYEAEKCGGKDLSLNQTMSGAKLVATAPNNHIDFALLKINNTIPKSYKPFLAGWNRENVSSVGGVGIHHPQGDLKKISVAQGQVVSDSYGDGYDNETHWRVATWAVGATEGGSSGSPFFNLNHQVIGDLTGGESSCDRAVNDYYSKIASAWANYSPSNQRLKPWLDPIGTGETAISGCDPYEPRSDFDLGIKSIESPEVELCSTDKFQPTIMVKNFGYKDISRFTAKYSVDGESFVNLAWTGYLLSGSGAQIVFPQIQLPVGSHKFVFIIEYPNGLSDLVAENDTMYRTVTIKNGESVSLSILTDGAAKDTWWTLSDQSHTVINRGDSFSDYTKSTSLLCLNPGCYTFTMNDRSSNGLCCNDGTGYYSLYDNITYTTLGAASSFAAMDEVDFCIKSAPFDYDLELYSITKTQKEYCLTNKFKPSVVFKNKGVYPLTEAKIVCEVDGKKVYEKKWKGQLLQYAKDTLGFDYVKLADGIHKVLFTILRTDGMSEQNTSNDTLSTYVSIVSKPITHLEMYTDKKGAEISWEILDKNKNVVYSGGPYISDSIYLVKQDFCLEPQECYTYTVYDSGLDGICCDSGYGRIFFYGDTRKDTILYANKFNYTVSNASCTETVSAHNLSTYNFKIFPNPAKGTVTFETDKVGIYEVWISTLAGQQVGHHFFNSNISSYDCSGLASGIYIVRFVGDGETGTIKLVVSH